MAPVRVMVNVKFDASDALGLVIDIPAVVSLLIIVTVDVACAMVAFVGEERVMVKVSSNSITASPRTDIEMFWVVGWPVLNVKVPEFAV